MNRLKDTVDDFELTRFGFRWGPMHVNRCCSDEKGGVVLRVSAKAFPESCERYVEIRVSPKGRIVETWTHGDVRKP